MIRKPLLIGLVLLVPALGFAESQPEHPRADAAAKQSKESVAAQRERERRQDLERRIEKLEQRYELTEPSMPPPDAPSTKGPVR
jgi:hypothetical protein